VVIVNARLFFELKSLHQSTRSRDMVSIDAHHFFELNSRHQLKTCVVFCDAIFFVLSSFTQNAECDATKDCESSRHSLFMRIQTSKQVGVCSNARKKCFGSLHTDSAIPSGHSRESGCSGVRRIQCRSQPLGPGKKMLRSIRFISSPEAHYPAAPQNFRALKRRHRPSPPSNGCFSPRCIQAMLQSEQWIAYESRHER
jgi:hypothetical protein